MRSVFSASVLVALLVVASGRADTIRLLDDNRDAWSARLDLIGGATKSLDAAYFIAADDQVSHAMLAHFRDAARRGVKVRLLIDSFRNHIPRTVQVHLMLEGVEIRVFNPLCVKNMLCLSHRMHDKLLIQDEKAFITGGRNIEATYFGLGEDKNYRDRDAMVIGSSTTAARRYFDMIWASKHVAKVTPPWPWEKGSLGADFLAKADRRLNRAAATIAKDTRLLPDGKSPPPAEFVVAEGAITFLHAERLTLTAKSGITQEVLRLLGSAEREIVIETPYLQLSRRFLKAIGEAVERGVKVRIVTNSLASIDTVIAYAGYANQKRTLGKIGVELWEYGGPECLHAKTMLIDDRVIVGSYNLNARSEWLDTEVAIQTEDKRLAARLRESVETHIAASTPIFKRDGATPAPTEAIASKKEPATPQFSRWLTLPPLRVVAVFIKSQL